MAEKSDDTTLSSSERNKISVLVVEADAGERNNMRTALRNLGFGNVTDAPNHAAALERIQQRPVTHVIFDAKKTNMPTKDFLQKVLEMGPQTVAIPSSWNPNIDDVFDLLVLGARGYLCKPFTAETVDAAVVNATKGEPMAEAVLHAKDRNEALVAIMMGRLDNAATILRQATQFETAKREIPRAMAGFKHSAELAKTFAKGGDEALFEAMEKFCIERSKGPATRLGRLRKRLKTTRVTDEDGAPAEESGKPNP